MTVQDVAVVHADIAIPSYPCASSESKHRTALRLRRIAPLRRSQVEVDGRQFCGQKLGRRGRRERGKHLHITPADFTCGGAVLRFLAFDMEVTQNTMIARAAKWAQQARKFPFSGTEAAPEQANLLQAAKLA